MENTPTDANLSELIDQAQQTIAQAQRLRNRKTRALQSSDDMPRMTDGPQITVSIAWINWMIDFFEADEFDPSLEKGRAS